MKSLEGWGLFIDYRSMKSIAWSLYKKEICTDPEYVMFILKRVFSL